MIGSVSKIETMGLVDGPGVRFVVFLNSCMLRCIYCHNPETWKMGEMNYKAEELVEKIKRYKPYFKDTGGVTFSGGEPMVQKEFLIECCKLLKEENIHIALDTCGVARGLEKEILDLVDLVIFDIKHVTEDGYKFITGVSMDKSLDFIKLLNESNKEVWLRQVIIPNITDTEKYIDKFIEFTKDIKNVTKVEFLPYHKLGSEKYIELNIPDKMADVEPMDIERTNALYQYFLKNK